MLCAVVLLSSYLRFNLVYAYALEHCFGFRGKVTKISQRQTKARQEVLVCWCPSNDSLSDGVAAQQHTSLAVSMTTTPES